jgi:hypothetical protein
VAIHVAGDYPWHVAIHVAGFFCFFKYVSLFFFSFSLSLWENYQKTLNKFINYILTPKLNASFYLSLKN